MGNVVDPGVNQRALATLFEQIKKRSSTHIYNLQISIVDIYNNNIRDLLSGSSPTGEDCEYLDCKVSKEVSLFGFLL